MSEYLFYEGRVPIGRRFQARESRPLKPKLGKAKIAYRRRYERGVIGRRVNKKINITREARKAVISDGMTTDQDILNLPGV